MIDKSRTSLAEVLSQIKDSSTIMIWLLVQPASQLNSSMA